MTYFNITFGQNNQYSIQETKTKVKKRHNALSTLEKIERTLKENLKYSSTFPQGHSLHKMKKVEAVRLLQVKASEIHQGYVKKQSKLCWLWRKIFSKKKKVDAIYKRIANFTLLTENALPILHDDGISEVFKFLPIDDLKRLRQVNAHAKAHADLALKNAARKLGYKGKKIGKARRYLKILSNNLRTLSQQDWKYGVNGNNLFKDLVIYKNGQIAIEESLNRLKRLSIDDLAKLFAKGAYLMHLKKAILTPQISTGEVFTDLQAANRALYKAVKNREFEVVQFLLSHGADAHFKKVLSLSIEQKTHSITHLLLQAKANIDPDSLREATHIPNNQKNIKLLLKYGAYSSRWVLLSAIENKNLANVRALIKIGADLTSAKPFATTVLTFALAKSTPEIIKLLLEHGADPNYNGNGKPPLHFAVENNSPEIIKLLMKHGANPYQCDNLGNSPLQIAIRKKNVAQVLAFIEVGVNLNHTDKNGQTALHFAAEDGTAEIIKLLLKHGANPNAYSKWIGSPFSFAIKDQDLSKAHAFLEGGVDLNYVDKSGSTALHIAAQDGTAEIIKLLLKHGANPNTFNHLGSSPLDYAIWCEDLAKVNAFIEGGVNLNLANKDGNTPLHTAAYQGTPEIIKLLLKHGANPNTFNHLGSSPLDSAIWCKDLAKIDPFIEGGVNLNLANKDGKTPLHTAAYDGTPEIIKLLLKHGANPNAHSKWLNSPFYITYRDLAKAHTFIKGGIDLNYVDKHGATALYRAAQFDAAEIIKLMIKHGADPNLKDNEGRTALHKLVRFGTPEIIKLLIKHGADPNLKDQDGQTALHIAARFSRYEIIKLLIKRGANPKLKDNKGRTPDDFM